MGKTKSKIVETFKQKILHALHEQPNNISLKMALKTAAVIQMAPTLILIGYDGVNGAECTNDGELWRIISPQAECCDIQAIGAAIQNLILEAESRNIGSLWVCDILYAYDEIMEIVGFDTQIIAGVVLGYSDETPIMPPRNINKIQWLV
jgi:nitroreductase